MNIKSKDILDDDIESKYLDTFGDVEMKEEEKEDIEGAVGDDSGEEGKEVSYNYDKSDGEQDDDDEEVSQEFS